MSRVLVCGSGKLSGTPASVRENVLTFHEILMPLSANMLAD
jgi:hypothetical protein